MSLRSQLMFESQAFSQHHNPHVISAEVAARSAGWDDTGGNVD